MKGPARSQDEARGPFTSYGAGVFGREDGGVLGLSELEKPPVLAARGGCWFRGYGMELHLGVEEDFRPARKAHPGLLVPGLDDWAGRLRDAGYPVLFDDEFPGMRRFYSQDPHGNRLEFLEPIAGA